MEPLNERAALVALVQGLELPVQSAHRLVSQLHASLRAGMFYLFNAGRSSSPAPAGARRPRMIVAFRTPDDALAFAQRNGLGAAPPLRRLALPQILALVLQGRTVAAVRFADTLADQLPPGRLPPGQTLHREELLAALWNAAQAESVAEEQHGQPL